MFCTSLRKRKDWEHAIAAFLEGKDSRWRESRLNTHDVAVPLPKSSQSGQHHFLFVLLSPADLGSPETEQRVDRLHHLTGGNDVGLVFLLDGEDSMSGYMQLQLSILDKPDLPLLPVPTARDLPKALLDFQQQLVPSPPQSRAHQQPGQPGHPFSSRAHPPALAIRTLLPYCGLRPPLSEHAVHILSDVTTGFADLVDKAGSDAGRALLAHWLGEEDAQRVVYFWSHEYTAR